MSPDNTIESYQFAIGGSRMPDLADKASKRFLFGESRLLDSTQVRIQLENLVAKRNFATIFHGTKLDIEVLNDLGVDLILRGASIFDTNKVAQWPLQLHYRLSLEKLCHTRHSLCLGTHRRQRRPLYAEGAPDAGCQRRTQTTADVRM